MAGKGGDGAARQVVAERFASRYGAERDARVAELARLQLVAQHDGVLRDVDPSLRPGSWVNATTPIAWLVDSRRWRAEAMVSEQDALRLSAGQRASIYVQGGNGVPLEGTVLAADNHPSQKLPHLLLAQSHGGPIALSPGAPPAALRPSETLYRVLVEGDGALDVEAVRLARAHFHAEPVSLARRWAAAAISAVIQQADF
ncbi:HlyD family secretion protein [Variovorax rhizosphaerae]|uniref:HlyD family secretion protein n=1 Tax=Variovorax rhizosphaerae TaxID=1836200 RepID=A0ABU8WE85_9BURK